MSAWLLAWHRSPPGCRVFLRRFWQRSATALAVFGLATAVTAEAQEQRPLDSAVKAVYLLNFGRFATWPRTADGAVGSAFNVCVLGPDPFGTTLDTTVKGETIEGRHVAVKRIDSLRDQTGCRILFMGSSEGTHVKQMLPALAKEGVLTVSDMPHFTDLGGMIEFVLEGSKVRFRVNVGAVDQAGLVLSSELLRVAASVINRPTTP
jgi:hypothetical protein